MSCTGSRSTPLVPQMAASSSKKRSVIGHWPSVTGVGSMVHFQRVRQRLDYGTTGLEVDLPDTGVTVIEPVHWPAARDVHGTLLKAIRHPMESAPLSALVKPGQRVAISVCDITRAQPRQECLRAIFEVLPHVQRSDV